MLPRIPASTALFLLFLPLLTSALSYDCKNIVKDGVKFNFEALGGLHSVSWNREFAQGYMNTTFKMDICQPLKLEDKEERKDCGHGTQSSYTGSSGHANPKTCSG